ncbi:hypothetical protein ZWY2020_025234 [Hordeum vulgare]|nr:hypothetical protein ZWY2020_025234 [Hordeum vulgare]
MGTSSSCHIADDETASGVMSTVASRVADSTVASRVADICEMIDQLVAGTTLSARRIAAISAMIDEVAQGRRRRTTRKRRMGNSRCYEQVSTLGEGTYGVVVKARHRATGQTVALKTLRSSPSQESVGELLREACFMAACSGHASLVALRGLVRTPSTNGCRDYYLVMEYVGPNLRQVFHERIQRGDRPFPEADVRCIVRQLLAGAETMHRNGVVHRDIKPENILVVQDGSGAGNVVKIGDYGLALSTDEQEDGTAGTRYYMAPEVLLEKPDRDTLVDLWSIGCVMAELLTGKTLFDGDDEADQLHKIFDLLGVPDDRAFWFALNSPLLGEEVQLWQARQRSAAGPENRLRELFPEALLSKEGFEVLQGLLTCNPQRRLDAAAALRLPWFADTDSMPVAAVPETGAPTPRPRS